jgi:RNA recognition motif-containing protein
MLRIYVGNLRVLTTENELRSMFEVYGEVGAIEPPADRGPGPFQGFAFVEMRNKGEMKKAIAGLNGVEFNGACLIVGEAGPRIVPGSGRGGHRSEQTTVEGQPEVTKEPGHPEGNLTT